MPIGRNYRPLWFDKLGRCLQGNGDDVGVHASEACSEMKRRQRSAKRSRHLTPGQATLSRPK